MSVWGHAGARSPTPKVACISFIRPFFGTLFSIPSFLFQLHSSASTFSGRSRRSMELSTGEELGASARSRSRSPEATSHQPPTTPAVVVALCDEMAITPIMDSQLDARCSACTTASRRIPHTCQKARGVNKRHTKPAGDVLRTKRSSVAAALGFRAPHHAEISVDVDSLSSRSPRAGATKHTGG